MCFLFKTAKPQVEILTMPSEQVRAELDSAKLKLLFPTLLDYFEPYYYTKAEDWAKVFDWLYFKNPMPKYIAARFDCEVAPELAYTMGLFYAEGTCSLRGSKYNGANWNISNTNADLLERCIKPLEDEWSGLTFRVATYPSEAKGQITNLGERSANLCHLIVGIEHPKQHRQYPLEYGGRGKFIKEWEQIFYAHSNGKTYKKVPATIIESSNISKKAFLEGVIDGDGCQSLRNIYTRGEFGRLGLLKLMFDIGWGAWCHRDKRSPENFVIHYNRSTEDLQRPSFCDDFAIWMKGLVAATFGLNYFGVVFGNTPAGYHAYNIFKTEAGLLLFEPQTGDIFEVGARGYFSEWILL